MKKAQRKESETKTDPPDSPPQADPAGDATPSPLAIAKTVSICAIILVAAAFLIFLIFRTEPAAERIEATRKSAMLVDVVRVTREDHRPVLLAMGTVTPTRDIILSPQVSGRIVSCEANFIPGGLVREGDPLLHLEAADYENTLRQRQSDERQAVAELEIEMGRQKVAREGYDLLNERMSEESMALVLRRPQLNVARARLEAARAALDQARLDLERTTIVAPFDAQVVSRDANVGSLVSPGGELGRLVGVESYWVEATVPLAQLRWLRFGEGDGKGSVVRVRNRSAWPDGVHREGTVDRLIGTLEERSRLARVLVTVRDPLLRDQPNSDLPPLIIGSFVEAAIELETIPDVIRLDRDLVRREDTVWVMRDGKLDIRQVGIFYQDAAYAYIREGLEDGETVVTSNLAAVVQDAPLQSRTGKTVAAGLSGETATELPLGGDR